mmetsp:Transcript_50169/g.115801  ORF Transcript_50169/g.115801 Transcript_50169/m.115801 type:complete len:151 (-) Transcript_50169:3068-3520(-)
MRKSSCAPPPLPRRFSSADVPADVASKTETAGDEGAGVAACRCETTHGEPLAIPTRLLQTVRSRGGGSRGTSTLIRRQRRGRRRGGGVLLTPGSIEVLEMPVAPKEEGWVEMPVAAWTAVRVEAKAQARPVPLGLPLRRVTSTEWLPPTL